MNTWNVNSSVNDQPQSDKNHKGPKAPRQPHKNRRANDCTMLVDTQSSSAWLVNGKVCSALKTSDLKFANSLFRTIKSGDSYETQERHKWLATTAKKASLPGSSSIEQEELEHVTSVRGFIANLKTQNT